MPSNRNLFRPRSASTSDGGIFADRSCGWSPERTVALPMPRLWVPDPQDDGHHRAPDVARRSGEVHLHDRPQGLGGRTPARGHLRIPSGAGGISRAGTGAAPRREEESRHVLRSRGRRSVLPSGTRSATYLGPALVMAIETELSAAVGKLLAGRPALVHRRMPARGARVQPLHDRLWGRERLNLGTLLAPRRAPNAATGRAVHLVLSCKPPIPIGGR